MAASPSDGPPAGWSRRWNLCVQACSGVWVAHGAGTADRAVVDRRDGLQRAARQSTVPAPAGLARRRRSSRATTTDLRTKALWPLCHRAHVRARLPVGRLQRPIATVNARFADAVCEEAEGESPLVLVQDYHFALAPQLDSRTPPAQHDRRVLAYSMAAFARFRDLPVGSPSCSKGLLGSSIVGFQTPLGLPQFHRHRRVRCSAAQVDREHNVITYAGRQTMVRAYPVSVEWPNRWACRRRRSRPAARRSAASCDLAPDVRLGVGVDRMDYTKGIEEKFLAVERLLESRPELRERFVFVQIAEPSRELSAGLPRSPVEAVEDGRTHQRAIWRGHLPSDRPARVPP